MTIQPGSFVQLRSGNDATYQVLSMVEDDDRCWVRRWPLGRRGSPPFAVPLHQLYRVAAESETRQPHHRPLAPV